MQKVVGEELAQSVTIVLHFPSNTSKGVLRLMGGLTPSGHRYSGEIKRLDSDCDTKTGTTRTSFYVRATET